MTVAALKSLSMQVAVGVAAILAGAAVLLLMLASGADAPRPAPDVAMPLAIGGLAVALLGALVVFHARKRRLQRIAAALDAIERGQGGHSLRGVVADGDELDRLAARIERLAERVSSQQAALDQATRQRSELLANVSHDLRTPLASMQGYLELLLLRDDLSGAEARNYLQTAARQSERLGRLVADLFELTRLEAEGMRPDVEEFAIAELTHDVVQKFSLDAERRGVRLACGDAGAPASPSLRVRADIGLAERVLAGLVENALRHTPSGGSVTLATAATDGRAVLTVADTGEGIAAADLPGLFDRYYRAERVGSANRISGHGGLGLAIARRIVQLHGGELAVESRVGEGTRIRFDLPLAAPTESAAPAYSARDAVA
ncbi:MAG: HAMP domain-containing sensor histidine kinase [Caldimonas sp.]